MKFRLLVILATLGAAFGGELAPAQELNQVGGSLVFVEGQKGSGSGFVCKIGTNNFVVTNQHVIAGQLGMRFTLLDRKPVRTGAAVAALGHDIIAFKTGNEAQPLEIMASSEMNGLIGDEVIVLGNTEGARVVQPIRGKVLGIGPDLVEVSAAFLPGNSGSPIIHLKTGKVIGVATYLVVRQINIPGERAGPRVRRFGFRLDSVKDWQPVVWAGYHQDFVRLENVQARTTHMADLLGELSQNGKLDIRKHQDPAIKPALVRFSEVVSRKGISAPDRLRALRDLMAALRTACASDIEQTRPLLRYDFFKRQLSEEAKVRSQFWAIFDRILKSQQ